jgi:alpha-1,4-digalacturonate transport system permease protein
MMDAARGYFVNAKIRIPRGISIRRAVVWFLVVAGAILMLFPIYWIFATAVRPQSEIFSKGTHLWPSEFVWNNFVESWNQLPFTQWYINSFTIAIIAVAITVFINLLAGYTFAKYSFRGRTVLFYMMIGTLMVPIQVWIVPQFLVVAKLGWVNSYWGVIFPTAAEAFGIFMVRQFMLSIPDDLIEAARLDGASEFTIFRKVVLPLSWPVIAVLTIFTFMWRWNDFAWPIVVLQDRSAYTVQLGLNFLKGQYTTDWTSIMAMSLVSMIPMLLVFAFFQRYFVEGFVTSGMK